MSCRRSSAANPAATVGVGIGRVRLAPGGDGRDGLPDLGLERRQPGQHPRFPGMTAPTEPLRREFRQRLLGRQRVLRQALLRQQEVSARRGVHVPAGRGDGVGPLGRQRRPGPGLRHALQERQPGPLLRLRA